MPRLTRRLALSRDPLSGLLAAAAAVAVVTGVIALLDQLVPALGLTSLYLFAILPVAIGWGFWLAGMTAVAAFLTFEYFFVPPAHSLEIADADTAAALLISILVAYLVSDLARRARARAQEAQLRARDARDAQQKLAAFADEQAALRRVATLVAQAPPPEQVFEAVTEEVGRVLAADEAAMARCEADGTLTLMAFWTATGRPLDLDQPAKLPVTDEAVGAGTGSPRRDDDHSQRGGTAAELARRHGVDWSTVAAINVAGRRWGVMVIGSKSEAAMPPGTEERLAHFTDLVAMAIANAEARAELTASRRRIVAAADQARRRLERNLHDGVQQRLVALELELRRFADREVPEVLPDLRNSVRRHAGELADLLKELQEISRGIHPAILSKGGLAPAVRLLVRRTTVPTEASVQVDRRLPEQVEVAAYYVVAEALANAAKHARATRAAVSLRDEADTLRIEVRDDGEGGADPRRGSGLVGLADRVESLGGTVEVRSPPNEGTLLCVTLPLRDADGTEDVPATVGPEEPA